MFGLGGFEIAIIAIFGFLIFGPDKLPQIARTIGRGIRQFRSAQEQMNKVIKSEVYDPIKDLEPLANPFAGFSLDPNKSDTASKTGGKSAANKEGDAAASQKKISGDAMKAAISAEAAKAKKKAAGSTTPSDKTAIETSATKKTESGAEAKSVTADVPESFAQRRARLEQEHARAKAAKAKQAVGDTVKEAATGEPASTTASAEETSHTQANDVRKEDKESV